jgi:hypothetical protein
MTDNSQNKEDCCKDFDPAVWDEKEHVWQDKLFITDSIPLFMHIPLPWLVSRVISKLWNKAKEAGADTEEQDFLLLAHDSSPWRGEYYLNVTKEIPDVKNVKLSGTFLSKVFDGPYNAVPKWIPEINKFAESKGKKVKDYYFFYATCPKCAKKFGHNYVIAFAEVE